MAQKWLEHQENQELLYQLSRGAIQTVAPYEIYLLDEVFPAYIELAQEGEVDAEEQLRREFAIAGAEELLIVCIIPALAMTLGLLLTARAWERISELRGGEAEEGTRLDQREISSALDQSLSHFSFSPQLRTQLREALLRIIWQQLR